MKGLSNNAILAITSITWSVLGIIPYFIMFWDLLPSSALEQYSEQLTTYSNIYLLSWMVWVIIGIPITGLIITPWLKKVL